MEQSKSNPSVRIIFLILTITAGIAIFSPCVNYHNFLSQGDHGRELYSIKMVYEGALPYRDFTLFNGPLMLYYYSAFFHIFGVSIQSVLLAQTMIIIFVGVMMYLIASIFISPAMSFLCTLWYWAFRGIEFFYSYNHIGAIFFMLLAVYFLCQYIWDQRQIWVVLGTLCIFCLCFIRANIGISTLFSYFLCLTIIDFLKNDSSKNKKAILYSLLFTGTVLLTFFIYWNYLSSVPKFAPHDLGYFQTIKIDQLSYKSFIESMLRFCRVVYFNFTATPARTLFGVIVAISILLLIRTALKSKTISPAVMAICSLLIFSLLNLHEYLAGAAYFRINWSLSLFILTLFLIIGSAASQSSRLINLSLLSFSLLIPLPEIIYHDQIVRLSKRPSQLLSIGENKVYVANESSWIKTVTNVATYIRQHTQESEKILSFPHDALYYFLTDRSCATRDLMLTMAYLASAEQENEIIGQLEKEKVNYVILSNRAFHSLDENTGVFGKNYGHVLYYYFDLNFETAAAFGEWGKKAGWVTDHAVKILKRKKSL